MKQEIVDKLVDLYKQHSPYYDLENEPGPETQVCMFWELEGPYGPPNELEATDALNAMNDAFDLDILEEEACEMFDMEFAGASDFIGKLIEAENRRQGKDKT